MPRRNRRRLALVALLCVGGVALAAYAFGSDGEAETAAAIEPDPATASVVAPAEPEAPPATPSSAADPFAPVEAFAPAPAAPAPADVEPAAPASPPPPMPRALGEASREAGPMPAPTFPSLREGTRPQAPHVLPEGSPYAVDVRATGQVAPAAAPGAPAASPPAGVRFGSASVPNGRSFLIRMSQAVTAIRGVAREDGFTVTIPNSLSLDRAGPIAAAHPLVERAMILNRGDHAELTIVFVVGRQPSYRVEARGAAIEVVIGR